jgi:hypothetical protein
MRTAFMGGVATVVVDVALVAEDPDCIGCGAAEAVPASTATAAMAKSEDRGARRFVRMVVGPGGHPLRDVSQSD